MKYLLILFTLYHWGRIVFLETGFDTDLLLYRERSTLLLPDRHEENRFVVTSGRDGTFFYIGSSSEGQFQMLKSFFERVYPCTVRKCGAPDGFIEGRVYINSRRNRKREDFYYPSFMRNVINIPSMIPGLEIQYQALVKSSFSLLRRRKYSFAVLIGYTGNAESVKAADEAVKDEMLRLKRRFGWKFRMKRKSGRLRSFSMVDPFSLSSFIRITADEEMVQ